MSDFVEHPLQKKLNRKNIFSRVDKLESKTGVGPSARLNALSDLTPNLGEQVAGIFKCIDPNTGSLRGYMAAIPQPNAPGYHLAFFDNAGVLQFGVDANNGSAIAGGGVVTLDANGASITVPTDYTDTNAYKFVSGGSSIGGLYGRDFGGTKWVQLRTIVTGDAASGVSAEGTSSARTTISASKTGANSAVGLQDGQVTIYGSEYIYLNAPMADSDTVIKGEHDSNLIYADASTDRVGIGIAVPTVKLDINGTVNIPTGNTYNINGNPHTHTASVPDASPITCNMITRDPTSTGQGTWARAVNASFFYNGYFGNNATHANGDNFTVNFYLPAGTYKLRFNASKSSASGIIKVEVGATNLGDTDLYAASPNYTNVVEYTNISIATGGLYAVKFTLNSKNGSSSSYYFDITQIEFIRTA